MKHLFFYLFTFLPFYLLVSCTQDNYEKGEGEYSLMRADFIEAHVGSDKRVDYIVTDDGDSLTAEPRFTIKSITVADTTYRAILYYNKVKNNAGKTVVEAMRMSVVPTLFPQKIGNQEQLVTDPVNFESVWLGANRRYLNSSIIVMTGKPDDEEIRQTIALIQDTIVMQPDGKLTAHYRLYHDQGGVPEYYSARLYLSIPVSSIKADSVHLTVNTYKGEIVKCIPLIDVQ